MTRSKGSRERPSPGTVRIIGGQWKRRVLDVVDAPGLRPTPGRVRETLFNWLNHVAGGDLRGWSVLDLYAGTGALGFEAASRGAAPVVLVESSEPVVGRLRVARTTLAAGAVDVMQGEALQVGERLYDAGRRFDLILLDPPFGRQHLETALPLARRLGTAGGWIYIEAESAMSTATLAALDLEAYRADKAGEVFYHLLRRNIKES